MKAISSVTLIFAALLVLTPALYATDAAEIVRQAQKGGCDKLADSELR